MKRRMFSQSIVESDVFLDMPLSAQGLYFHLCMNADDYGFISPKRIMRMIGANNDDLQILIAKRYVLLFDSGVVVIKHWQINNTVRKDRSLDTTYQEEFEQLTSNTFGAYTEISKVTKITNEATILAIENNIDKPQKNVLENNTEVISTTSVQLPIVENVTTSNRGQNSGFAKRQPNDNQMTTKIRLDYKKINKKSLFLIIGKNKYLFEPLTEFINFRKSLKRPLTDHGLKLLVNKLERMYPEQPSKQIECLNNSIVSGWLSVWKLDEGKQQRVYE